jgi:hypothetical protein
MKPTHPRLYRDAFALVGWLLQRLDDRPGLLARHTCEAALSLLDDVVIALDDPAHASLAVDAALRLGQRLRLAAELGLLGERQLLHALERLDGVRGLLEACERAKASA